MKEENLKKALNELKEVRMTSSESEKILESVFRTPIPTPYFSRNKVFAMVMIVVLVFSTGGVTYASSDALPGDILYPVKVKVVEPILDVVNSGSERKVTWSEEKVTRRIEEADALAKDDKLDDKKALELEKEIRKSSIEFAKAVEERDEDDEEEKEKRKEEFRKKVSAEEKLEVKVEYIEEKKPVRVTVQSGVVEDEDDEKEEIEKREKKVEQSEKVRKIKDTAIKTLDKEDNDRKDEKEKGRSDEDKNQKKKKTR